MIAGLAEAGLDMTEAADLVIGTSSGATAAAQVRSGVSPAELFASVLSPPVPPVGQNRERPPALPMATVFERMRAISVAATSATELQRAQWARSGWSATPYSDPPPDATAPWSPLGCLAMNGRTDR